MSKTAVTTLLLIAILLIPANNLRAEESDPAVLYFSPDLENYFDPEFLYVDLMIDPAGQAINSVSADISYDPEYLFLESADYTNSFCQLFLPGLDGAPGIFSTACGSPVATTTAANIVNLKFRKLQTGMTKLGIEDSTVLLHDGCGTKLYTENRYNYIEIVK